MLDRQQPDWVVHLAAQSHVPSSWADPAATFQINVGGTATLLKVLTETGFKGRLLYVSSADVYGSVPAQLLPLSEDVPAEPRNPYAASKLAAEMLCRQWARAQPLDIVIARPFNHTGPGQRPDFALPAFARDIAAIKQGRQPATIMAGDLGVTRDFLDVRDVVAAYVALLDKGRSGEIYNVCSGRESNLSEALQALIALSGVRAEITADPSRMRPSEQRRMCGSHDKLTAATGWQPAIPLRETLGDLLDFWMKELDS